MKCQKKNRDTAIACSCAKPMNCFGYKDESFVDLSGYWKAFEWGFVSFHY